MEAGADLQRYPGARGIDPPLSAPGADRLTTKAALVTRKAPISCPVPRCSVKIAKKTQHGNILTRRTALTARRTSARRNGGNRTAIERAGRECEPARRAGVPGHGETPA